MKIFNIITLSFDSIVGKKLITLFIIAMNVVGLVLVDLTFSQGYKAFYKLLVTDEITRGRQETVNVIKLNTVDLGDSVEYQENVSNMLDDVASLEKVRSCGFFEVNSIILEQESCSEEYFEYLESLYTEGTPKNGRILQPAVSLPPELIEAGNVVLAEGTMDDFKEGEYIPVLAGSELTPYYKMGDTFKDYRGQTYKVVGILKKGTKWYSDLLIDSNDYCTDMDCRFFVGKMPVNNSGVFLYLSDNSDEKLRQQIRSTAAKHNLSVDVEDMKTNIRNFKRTFFEENKTLFTMVLFFAVISIIGISSASAVSVLTKKRDYGIMYSIGFNRRDIVGVIYFENLIKLLVSAVISYVIADNELNKEIAIMYFGGDVLLEMHRTLYPFVLIALVLVISVISTVVPYMIFRKQNITQMIGGTKC